MKLRKLLKWTEPDDFGQQEAKLGPYRLVAWQNKEYGELRLIRNEAFTGVITPVSDFSIYCKNRKEAVRTGEKMARVLKSSIEYNTFISPITQSTI